MPDIFPGATAIAQAAPVLSPNSPPHAGLADFKECKGLTILDVRTGLRVARVRVAADADRRAAEWRGRGSEGRSSS
ncbi:MAG: hypothetical protein L0Y71_13250 [Gemmataceae bacterium]|nr:hypothetical protein [Gemmataceae bacterium]